MTILLPDGRVHASEDEKIANAQKQLFIAAKHIGELNDRNPLVMALMMVDVALSIVNGVAGQDREAARQCYQDMLQSMVGFAKATEIAYPHVKVDGEKIIMPDPLKPTIN